MKKQAIIWVILLVFFGVALAQSPHFTEGSNAPPEPMVQAITEQWDLRDKPVHCQKTVELLNAALAKYPDWLEGYNWLGYARFMEGDHFLPKDPRRKASYKAGMEAGQKAIELDAKNAGAHHWYITNKACYGRERGIMRSVVYLPEILREINQVKQLDLGYDDGGPQRLITGIILQVPASLRKAKGYSLEDAEKEMRQAVKLAPDHPRNWLFLADVCLAMDKKQEAYQHLQHLVALTPDQCKGRVPELLQDQASAKIRLKEQFGQP